MESVARDRTVDGLTPPPGTNPGHAGGSSGEHDVQSIADAERVLLIQALTR